MPLTDPRIPPLPPGQWTDEVRELFTIFEGEDARRSGSKYNIMKTLAHHPSLMSRFLRYEHQLLRNPTIPERLREIIILRLAWKYRQEYEWRQHVVIGRSIGMSDADFDAIRHGDDAQHWSTLERNVLLAADHMHSGTTIDAQTWQVLSQHLGHRQMIEVLFTIGTFAMMSWIFNSTGLQLEAT